MKQIKNPNFERMRRQAERQRLAELEAHCRALDARCASLTQQLEDVDAFSDPAKLRQAVAPILPGAMRDAGADDGHTRMASSIAPYIMGTVRTEILNSEDELVEAIHPRLGTLISAAIANAIEELNRKVDDALPLDRWIASIKGRITGAPSAGFLLEDGSSFALRDAMLIDRQSGTLLAHEYGFSGDTGPDKGPDEDLMAGMIAALQGFAEDAYGNHGAGDLRRFSFTADTVYLRASPTKILAVRCSGVAPPEIERRVDDVLTHTLGRLQGDNAESVDRILLSDLEQIGVQEESSVSASTVLGRGFGVAAVVVGGFWGHSAVETAHQNRWLSNVERAVHADDTLSPFPLSVTQIDEHAPIRVSGLLPTEEAKRALQSRIEWLASPILVDIDIAVVAIESLR